MARQHSALQLPTGAAAAAMVAALLGLRLAEAGAAPWRLWIDPPGNPVVDQEQAHDDCRLRVQARDGHPVGQIFVPTRSPLNRIDFRMSNRNDRRPARIRLWRWQGSYEQTVAGPPLFSDPMEQSGDVMVQLRSVYPGIEVEVGRPHLALVEAPGRSEISLGCSASAVDRYPLGRLVRARGRVPATWDLWFRTFSSEAQSARPREPSASPTGPWTPPLPEGPLGPRHYLDRVVQYSSHVRRGVLGSCGGRLGGNAFREAFLYRVSCRSECDQDFAANARRMLLNSHAARLCGERPPGVEPCDPPCAEPRGSGEWLHWPAFAYHWTRESPVYEARDHERVRELFLEWAKRYWPRRHLGSQSRAMAAAVGYRLLADLYPDDPRARDWEEYAEEVWALFQHHWDTQEDSAQYTDVVWWGTVLEYIELTGREEQVWRDPGFRELVERSFDHVAPLGVAPNFGDSSGWGRDGGGGLIWLFEAAARHTREARFRWLAHRLFQHAVTRARDDPPRSDFLHNSLPYLARAYLSADESVPPHPPPPRLDRELLREEAGEKGWPVRRGEPFQRTLALKSGPLTRIELRVASATPSATLRAVLLRGTGVAAHGSSDSPVYGRELPLGDCRDGCVLSLHPFVASALDQRLVLRVEAPGEGFLLLEFRAVELAGAGSALTSRVRVTTPPRDRWTRDPIRSWRFGSERVPDKLVLRSGFETDDLHVLANLLGGEYRHGQREIGALVSLLDSGSAVLIGTPFPYQMHTSLREDESIPLLRRYGGGSLRVPKEHSEVFRFDDARHSTVAWIRFDDPSGWDVDVERDFYFVHNRFLLIRDAFRFESPMWASAGPVWHAGDLHPERGTQWFDVFMREPLSNVWKLRNPERHALLYFVERPETEMEARDEPSYRPPSKCGDNAGDRVRAECRAGPRYVVFQRWTGHTKRGTVRWFDSLLVPHGSHGRGQDALPRVETLHAGASSVALRIRVGSETWILVDSPEGEPIAAPGVEIAARFAILGTSPGRAPYLRAERVTRVRSGELDLRWAEPSSVELAGGLPLDRPVP